MRRFAISSLAAVLCAVLVCSAPARAELVTTPSGVGASGNTQMGEFQVADSSPNGKRFQTLYAANLFQSVAGPLSISGFAYRTASGQGAFSQSIPNLVITLSTTSTPDDGLSNVFASNIGLDATIVYAAPIVLSSAGAGNGSSLFDIVFNFTTPFFYNPAQGNLLVDMQFFGQRTGSGSLIDAVDAFGDGISRIRTSAGTPNCGVDVYSLSGCSANGLANTSRGQVTQFDVTPVPEPETYAMMLAGLGLLGFVARRRKQSAR